MKVVFRDKFGRKCIANGITMISGRFTRDGNGMKDRLVSHLLLRHPDEDIDEVPRLVNTVPSGRIVKIEEEDDA